jgi:hypothetical protein
MDGSDGVAATGDRWLTVAGFAAPDDVWGTVEHAWSRMLRERYPIAPYLHMWELISATDPFERQAGWKKEQVMALVSDAVRVVQTYRDTLHSFSCRLNLSAWERITAEGEIRLKDPYEICGEMTPTLALWWYFAKMRKLERCFFMYDRGERFMQSFKEMWLRIRTPPGKIATNPDSRLWDLIENIIDGDMQRNPGLQMADLIAWGTSRDLANKLGELYDLDEYMRNLHPDEHAIIDEQILRTNYNARVPEASQA